MKKFWATLLIWLLLTSNAWGASLDELLATVKRGVEALRAIPTEYLRQNPALYETLHVQVAEFHSLLDSSLAEYMNERDVPDESVKQINELANEFEKVIRASKGQRL